MSILKPFKAVRPSPERVRDVAALPYDVMTSDEAREMVIGNPYSFLHVDKAEIDLDKNVGLYDDIVYETARKNLDRMITEGTFIQDEKPLYYIYRLTMDGKEQTGLVACASIDEYIEGKIKKHELTREDKERDRIRHVDTCDANTGPIFLTYHAKKEIDEIISAWMKDNKPVYDFTAEDGIGHAVWTVCCDETIKKIYGLFAEIDCLYIADGHHRNASAVKVGLARRAANPDYDKSAEFNSYLAVIFPDDQLNIMDYNRVVKGLNGLSEEEFFAKVGEKFLIEEKDDAYKPEAIHTFGMYMNGKWYKLSAKPEIISGTDIVASLDVSILQDNLLKPLLGIDDPRTSRYIDFVGGLRGLAGLESRVNSGEMKLAFAMFPTSMGELMGIADSGLIMPPKSTWFEPKLRSGIFVHKLGE